MTTTTNTARPFSRWLAIALTSVLAATGAIVGTALPAAAAETYTITGTLYGETATGTAPLANTYLGAYEYPYDSETGGSYSTNTDANGDFTIDVPAAGDYLIRFNCSNCNTDFVWEYLGHTTNIWDADFVTVTDDEPTASVDFTLAAPSTISGVLVDELGDPLVNETVSAHRPDSYNGQYDLTDENGEFVITGVPSGEVVLETNPWDESTLEVRKYYATSYFGGGAESTEATVIDVTPGSTLTNKDFAAVLLPTFKARFTDEAGEPISGIYISRWTLNETTGIYEEPRSGESLGSNSDGWYGWSARPGESYKFLFSDQNLPSVEDYETPQTRTERYESEWYADAATLSAATPVSFAADSVEQKKVQVTLAEHTGPPTYLGGLEVLRDYYDPANLFSTAYSSFSPATVLIKREWFRNGVLLPDVEYNYELTDADVAGTEFTVRVTATTAATVEEQTSANTTVRTSAPYVVPGEEFTSTPTPTIDGDAIVGETLTADPKTWEPEPSTRSYQWLRDGEPIDGATGLTYELVAADLGTAISFETTGLLDGYLPVTTTSDATLDVIGVFTPPATIAAPTGTAAFGETLTASTGAWSPTADSFQYQWLRTVGQAAPVAIGGATGATYVLGADDVGASISVRVRAVKDGYEQPDAVTSATTAVVVSKQFTAVTPATVTGDGVVGQTLTATLGSYSPTPTTITYEWLRGDDIVQTTGLDYELTTADVGKTITFRAVAHKVGYADASAEVVAAASVSGTFAAPPAIGAPTGSPTFGQTLTAATGTWSPVGESYEYQWVRTVGEAAPVPIDGATAATYTLGLDDIGSTISVRVIAVKADYLEPAAVTSAATAVVAKAAFATPAPTTVSGQGLVGRTLTVTAGTYSPAATSVSYEWLRGADVAQTGGLTYALTPADIGKKITLRVVAQKDGFTDSSVDVVAAANVLGVYVVPATIAKPTGTPAYGETLTAVTGTWTPAPDSYEYQWLREVEGEEVEVISGATGATYDITTADINAIISVRVRAVKANYQLSPVKTSGTTDTVEGGRFTQQSAPTLAGSAVVGSTLTATPGAYTPQPTSTFNWLRGSEVVEGQNGTTYVLTTADIGKTITFRQTIQREGYLADEKDVTSAIVTAEGTFTTVRPAISGSAKVGSTLTAKTGVWTPAPDAYSYIWRVGGSVVEANGKTLPVIASYKGKTITVAVTGTKDGYKPGTSAQSKATVAVVAGTLTPVTPKLAGSTKVGGVISVKAGSWGTGVTYTYQWLRNGKAISKATKATYTLTSSDLGKKISVTVKGAKSGYTSVTRTSNVSKAITKGSITGSKAVITGTAKVGSKLTATAAWGPGTIKKTYQWYLNGKAISKATASTYNVPASALKKKITVRIVGSRSGYTTVTKTTSAVTIAAGVFTKGVPTVTGTVEAGTTLKGARGTWSPSTGTTFTYQWFAKAGDDGAAVAIAGATKGSYVVTAANADKQIAIRVTAKRSGFTSASALSAYATPPTAQ